MSFEKNWLVKQSQTFMPMQKTNEVILKKCIYNADFCTDFAVII